MESEQPYRPPEADVGGPAAGGVTYGGGGEAITPRMVAPLVKTRPWVILLGVMTMIGCGFLILAGFAMVGMALFGLPGMGDEFGSAGGFMLAVVYLLMAFLYFFPGLYLLRYGRAIKEVDRVANGTTVEAALRHQLSFWRFVGILTVAVIALYLLIFVVAVLFGMFTAVSS